MSILHGDFYKHIGTVRTEGDSTAYEARIPVLMFLICTANKRLRTWHGIDAIMESTGYSKTPVSEALQWFAERGAIYNVPKEARSGREARVHGNRKVWQLTGIIQLGDAIVDYLFIKDEDRESSLLEIEDHAPENVKQLFQSLGLIEAKPEIGLQDRPIIGLQSDIENSEIGLQSKPEIGLQNDTAKELDKENLVKGSELVSTAPQETATDSDARVIISAWHNEADHGSELVTVLNMKRYLDTALKLIETHNVTKDEVIGCTQWKVSKPRTGAYLFWYLLTDITEYREKLKEDAIQAEKDKALETANIRAWKNQAAMKAELDAFEKRESA